MSSTLRGVFFCGRSLFSTVECSTSAGVQVTCRRGLFSFLDASKEPSEVRLSHQQFSVERHQNHRAPNAEDFGQMTALVDGHAVTDDRDQLLDHNTDWMRTFRGESKCVLFPQHVGQLSAVLQYCHQRHLAVCPQGANCSLVGGSVPVFDEVIVNMSNMSNILTVDSDIGTVSCEAGCSLHSLQQHARKHSLFLPVDYSIGEAQIGGIVAADIAGPRTFRYGNLHGNVLGLEVVLPDGTVLDSMSNMRKDNTGFDLKQMFVGSEGCLGIITKVVLACPPMPRHTNVAMVYTDSFDKVVDIMRLSKQHLGEVMSACEFMDNTAVMSVKQKYLSVWGVPNKPFYVLIETAGRFDMHDEEKLKFLFNMLKDKRLIFDGQIGPLNYDDPVFVERLWNINTRILTALTRMGTVYHYDVSLPHSNTYQLVEAIRSQYEQQLSKVASFGHLLDGNLHLALLLNSHTTPADDEASLMLSLDKFIADFVTAAGGAVSAELGCGFKNRNLGVCCKSGAEMRLMRQVKNLLDPNNIMNPYKVFPDV